jgi:hypothetical protein
MTCLALVALVAGFASLPTGAQNSRGTILGHVTDSSGAALSGAKATVRNVSTNITNEYTTDASGDFVFVNLIPGSYQLTVSAQGFRTAEAAGLVVEVDHTLRQNFELVIGSVAEEVKVEASTQMLQTDNASLGTVISAQTIDDLPLSGRDVTNVLKLQAGATNLKGGSQVYWTQHGFNTEYQGTSIDGSRSESIAWLVDGVSNNDQFFASAANVPGAASIEEVKVQNGMYSAEYGQGSAQVNVAIKSGTNRLHGEAYDFLQNDAFNPSNPYTKWQNVTYGLNNPLKDRYKQNQFGGALGGPLVIPHIYDGRNKTFWFGNYEMGIQRRSSNSAFVVPSALERTGDFSDWGGLPIYDPATTGQTAPTQTDPSGRLQFADNKIPTGRFSQVATALLKYYPEPNVTVADMTSGNANYIKPVPKPFDTTSLTVRVDHQLTDLDRLFFTMILGDQNLQNESILPYTGELKYSSNSLYSVNWQHSFNANLFNEFRLGYTHAFFNNGAENASFDLQSQAGFKNVPNEPNIWSIPVISMNNYQTLGNGNSDWHQKNNNYQIVDNLKLVHGRHTITAGFDIRQLLARLYDNYGYSGTLTFGGNFTASDPGGTYQGNNKRYHGNSFADFLLGDPMSESSPNPVGSDDMAVHATNWNFFAQDDWRVTPKLTLNLGLRYELPPAYSSSDKSGMTLDLTNGGGFKWVDQSFVNKVLAVSGVNPNRLRCCADPKLTRDNHTNFSPRVGFAWRPLQTDRFVVRGGAGMFYDIYNRYYDLSQFDKDSIFTDVPFQYPGATGSESVPTWNLSNLWAPAAHDYSWFQSPDWYNGAQINWPDNKSPYTEQWTLDTQYSLTSTLLLDIGYVGSHALHEPGYWYFNSAPMPTGPYDACNQYRSPEEAQSANDSACLADPNFSPVSARKPFKNLSASSYANANIFTSNYNGLQLKLMQRYQHGLQYQVNYTWSRALDEDSAINNQDGESEFLQDQHNLHGDYGPANFDQTHRLVAYGTYDLPVGKGQRWSLGAANWVLGGWQVGGVYTAATGNPFTIYAPLNVPRTQAGTRADIIRPNLVGNPHAGQQTLTRWFNIDAFEPVPHDNQYGNVGRNTLRNAYYEKTDLTFGKSFRITENHTLQYKLEIFNFGSNWHSGPAPTPSSWVGSSNFGYLAQNDGSPGALSLWKPRTVQMDLKYKF